jgi:hypothetical protein
VSTKSASVKVTIKPRRRSTESDFDDLFVSEARAKIPRHAVTIGDARSSSLTVCSYDSWSTTDTTTDAGTTETDTCKTSTPWGPSTDALQTPLSLVFAVSRTSANAFFNRRRASP